MYQEKEMSFLEHLEELRWHIIRSTFGIVIAATIAFLCKSFLFDDLILGPTKSNFFTYDVLCKLSSLINLNSFCDTAFEFEIQSRTMAGQFSAHIWTSITFGFVIAFPYVLYEFWKFISPGLYVNEKKQSKGIIFICSMLFFIGVLFGYYVVCPLSINFLGNYSVANQVHNDFDLNSYIGLVRASVLASGLIFELPVVIYYLTKIGLVSPEFLKRNRKYALVIVLIFAAIITPPDVASQIIVAIPVIVLYQISISISKIVTKRQKIKNNI